MSAAEQNPAEVPESYGPIQAARRLGLSGWQFSAALRRGLIGPADGAGRWSGTEIEGAADRLDQIKAAVGDQAPIGAPRSAARISERLGIEVAADEVDALAERGLLAEAGEYKGWPLYDVHDLDTAADEHAALISELSAARLEWLEASLPPADAARELGWTGDELRTAAAQRGLQPGRFGRYARADVATLAGDEDAAEEIRGARVLGPNEAAEHLDVRRTDFDYCVAAGWITPARIVESKVGRRRWIEVPLYRVRDVEALRDLPGVDWEAVRDTKPGKPSPLREYAQLPVARQTVIRGFAADLSDRHQVDVDARYDDRTDVWTLAWSLDAEGRPSMAVVHDAVQAAPALADHVDRIRLRIIDPPDEAPSYDGTVKD